MIQSPNHHPYSSVLRQRAGHLLDLAATIERSRVTGLQLERNGSRWHPSSLRARMCEQMLERNLHQLHLAADDLRVTAFRLRRRADELDLAHLARSAA